MMRVQLLLCGWLVGEYYTRRRLISDATPDLLRAASRGEDTHGIEPVSIVWMSVGPHLRQIRDGKDWQGQFFFFGLSRVQ